MTPDDDRVNRLAERMAAMSAELAALKSRVGAYNGVPVQLAKLEDHVDDVRTDVAELTTAVEGITTTLNDRTRIELQERQAMRRVLVTLIGTILTALIAAGVVLLNNPPH